MSIKNWTTTISPEKTAGEVMGMLSKHAARQISMTYSDDGVLAGLSFTLRTEYGHREFALPVRVEGVMSAMKRDRSIPASKQTPEQATRVAWRIARDWLDTQLALVAAGLASLDEVMTPWMLDGGGRTMYEVMRDSGLRSISAGEATNHENRSQP
ncbi:hypothetical protein [Microbacterium excoecariae]|uniref:hypothetical protein n=1 Tax=Microbacterium excoecariae TaxID=2715210 RepID=UPI00140D7F62|nr:hypothetical protein [Microbacterium excoecariae]NHI16846.1 hypothetical protein [Microbacterium excoecariae]